MAIIERFNLLSLTRQMQILFILSTFTICGVLVVITRLQMDWIRSQILEDTNKAFSNRINDQVKSLGLVQAQNVNSFLDNALMTTKTLKSTSESIQGFNSLYPSSPFKTGTLISSADIFMPVFEHSSYYSKNQLSKEGIELLVNQSSLDFFYPYLYESQFSILAQGFVKDEIIVIYPASMIPEDYSPVVHEWYYKAKTNPSQAIITEPFYLNLLGQWFMTVSKAITNPKGQVSGVASITFTLSTIVKLINQMKVYGNGFALLVSKTGILLNYPGTWKNLMKDQKTLKVFDEQITGIDQDGWKFIQNAENGDKAGFVDGSDMSFKVFVFKIQPSSIGNLTHYLLICVEEKEISKSRDYTKNEFEKTYSAIFWITFSFGALICLVILALIHVFFLKCGWVLQGITNALQSMVDRGLFNDITKNVSFDTKCLEEIKGIVFLFTKKVEDVKNYEQSFSSFETFGIRTKEHLLYSEWIDARYPFNKYFDKHLSLRKSLKKIKSFPVLHWSTQSLI